MTPQPMANAKTEDFRNAHAALLRAAKAAQDATLKPLIPAQVRNQSASKGST